MEEKERYKIHRYTLQGNEKISLNDYIEHIYERYDFGFEKIKPFTRRIQDLLNEQSKRIKELELLLNADKKMKTNSIKGFEKLKQENQQLKQSQKQLAIEELRRIKEYILLNDEYDEEVGCNIIKTFDLLEDISDRIKKLKGEENANQTKIN